MRILVTEDDATLRDGLVQALAAAGHDATTAVDGAQADTLLATTLFDLLVLDLGLPRMDGLDVLGRLRARNGPVNQELPVLILSARDSMESRVRGLDLGADDYLTKPFDLREFDARIRALLRRGKSESLKLGLLEWTWATRCGRVGDGAPLPFSPHETLLLESLLRKAGRIVSKVHLATLLGDEGTSADNKVEVYVHRVRRKLVEARLEIQTVRGLGYLIKAMENGQEAGTDPA